jgi:hypothetical protein
MPVSFNKEKVSIDFEYSEKGQKFALKFFYAKEGAKITVSNMNGEELSLPAKMFVEVANFLIDKKLIKGERIDGVEVEQEISTTTLPIPNVTTETGMLEDAVPTVLSGPQKEKKEEEVRDLTSLLDEQPFQAIRGNAAIEKRAELLDEEYEQSLDLPVPEVTTRELSPFSKDRAVVIAEVRPQRAPIRPRTQKSAEVSTEVKTDAEIDAEWAARQAAMEEKKNSIPAEKKIKRRF